MNFTKEIIEKTRKFYADSYQNCIDEVDAGTLKVNDVFKFKFKLWKSQSIKEVLRGDYDGTFAFRQQATFFKTGKMIALLPK